MDNNNAFGLLWLYPYDLSGGELQRAGMAKVMLLNPKIILLDEPTTYLDIRYQLELLRLLKEINQKYKITIIMVLHDINQAIQYSDNIIAIKKGRIIVEGKSNEVITSEVIREIYGIDLKMTQLSKQPYVFTV